MKMKLLFCAALLGVAVVGNGQTLYVPSGSNGIGSSTNGNVGVGTNSPQVKLHIYTPAQDNLGLVIQGSTINNDANLHYIGLSFDGDYGNGTGNSSQIRSYSNLYHDWGSSLTFHTTSGSGNNLIERMRIDYNGNVGIGTTSPETKLHIVSDDLGLAISRATYKNNGSSVGVEFKQLTDNGAYRTGGAIKSISVNTYTGGQGNTYASHLAFFSAGNGTLVEGLRISELGNVLIGKTSQTNTTYKLDVAGKVRANEITVNTTGADFVFDNNYKLRTLAEVEAFIKTNKHLPDVASAADMQTNGVNMGDMQAKLLQKVEELTLYVIEQDKVKVEQEKQLQLQRQANEELQKEVKELKELLMKKLKQ